MRRSSSKNNQIQPGQLSSEASHFLVKLMKLKVYRLGFLSNWHSQSHTTLSPPSVIALDLVDFKTYKNHRDYVELAGPNSLC